MKKAWHISFCIKLCRLAKHLYTEKKAKLDLFISIVDIGRNLNN